MSTVVAALRDGRREANQHLAQYQQLTAEAEAMLAEHGIERDPYELALKQLEKLVKQGRLDYAEWAARSHAAVGEPWNGSLAFKLFWSDIIVIRNVMPEPPRKALEFKPPMPAAEQIESARRQAAAWVAERGEIPPYTLIWKVHTVDARELLAALGGATSLFGVNFAQAPWPDLDGKGPELVRDWAVY